MQCSRNSQTARNISFRDKIKETQERVGNAGNATLTMGKTPTMNFVDRFDLSMSFTNWIQIFENFLELNRIGDDGQMIRMLVNSLTIEPATKLMRSCAPSKVSCSGMIMLLCHATCIVHRKRKCWSAKYAFIK